MVKSKVIVSAIIGGAFPLVLRLAGVSVPLWATCLFAMVVGFSLVFVKEKK